MSRHPLPALTGLRAFEAFARLGSMTGAGAELCVTHGAVSRQVHALEAQLGVRLVEGPRHQLALTEAGRRLAAALSRAFDQIAEALPGAGGRRELAVACFGTLAMKWLIPRLPGFLEQHPDLDVRIVESHAPVDFSQGGLHAAIHMEDGARAEGLQRRPFMAHYHGPVVAAGLWARIGPEPERLLALPRLHSETFRPAWSQWARRAGRILPPATADRVFEHNTYMLEAAAAGLGAAVAPWAFAAPDIEAGRLVAPFGFAPVETRFAYWRPRLCDNAAAAAFGDWLAEQGRETPPPPARSATSRPPGRTAPPADPGRG